MQRAGLAAILLAAGGLFTTALADDEQSFTTLVSQGYEVKAVTLVPLDVAKRATKTVTTDTVLVTLQKSNSVAVCYVAFANWAFMNKASLATQSLCEVR